MTFEEYAAELSRIDPADFEPRRVTRLWVQVEKKAERLVASIAPGAVCTAQEWDNRVDCSIQLADGSVAAEMISLVELNEQRLRECAERLRRRAEGEDVSLVNERGPRLLISTITANGPSFGVPFGCLGAAALGSLLAFMVFVGTTMGDCDPGPGCHDNDGPTLLRGWMYSAIIAAAFGLIVGIIATLLGRLLHRLIGRRGAVALLLLVTLALVWFGVDPAGELLVCMEFGGCGTN